MGVERWKDHDDPSWDDETRKRMFAAYLGYLQGNGALPKSIKTEKFLGLIPYIPETEALKAYKMRNKLKLAAVLALNMAKKAGYADLKDLPAMNKREKKTEKAAEKPVGTAHVAPKGPDNAKKASEAKDAKDIGFLKAALDLGLSGKALDSFYLAAQQKLAGEVVHKQPTLTNAKNQIVTPSATQSASAAAAAKATRDRAIERNKVPGYR